MSHTKKPVQGSSGGLSRRQILGSAVSATSIALLPLAQAGRAAQAEPQTGPLSAQVQTVLLALVDRLVPADDNGPGALEAGAAAYIERSLAEWNGAELPELQGGLETLDAHARQLTGSGFVGSFLLLPCHSNGSKGRDSANDRLTDSQNGHH